MLVRSAITARNSVQVQQPVKTLVRRHTYSTGSNHEPKRTGGGVIWNMMKYLEEQGWKQSKPAITAFTLSEEMVMPTNSVGRKKTFVEKPSQDKRSVAKVTVTAGVKYFESSGDRRLKVPLDMSVHGVGEVTRRGTERRDGSLYEYTGTLGLKGKLKFPSFVPDLSVTTSPGYLDLRTGVGSKVEVNVGIVSLPSLTLTDSSSPDVMVRYEAEKSRARELIQSNRVENMDTIGDIVVEHGVSPITGEGMDEVWLVEKFDEDLNVKPGLEGAMNERNLKHGETFRVPLSEHQVNQSQLQSLGQKYQLAGERLLYGQHGKDGRLAPKEGRVQETPPKEGVTLEKTKTEEHAKPEVEKTGVEKQPPGGLKQEESGSDVSVDDSSSKDVGMESPQVESVRSKLGKPTTRNSSQETGLGTGKSVRDNIQQDSGTNKESTGPKLGTK